MSNLKTTLKALAAGTLLASAATFSATAPAAAQDCEVANLSFTFWGSASEKNDVEEAIRNFNETRPCINVVGQHIPSQGYVEKLTTMLASDTAPDVAYLGESQAFTWADEGRIMDLSPYMGDTPEQDYLRSTIYRAGDTLMGTGLATGAMLIYYNKSVFDDAGLEYPPANAANAWDWDTFADTAMTLTKDRSGRNAHDPDFDPDDVDTYGFAMASWWAGWMPFVLSNGGQFASEDGTQLLINEPEAVEVMQNLQDLVFKYHVSPTPAARATLPAADVLMQSNKVAMSMDGMWRVTDFNDMRMDWGIGVLPMYDEPVTVILSTPKVIFEGTEHPDEAFEFYQYISDPAQVGLFKSGLWAPHELAYFTEPDLLDEWVTAEDGGYPPEAMDAIVDYSLNYAPQQAPVYWVKNIGQIMNDAITPAVTKMLEDPNYSAQQAMDDAVATAEPMMQGRW